MDDFDALQGAQWRQKRRHDRALVGDGKQEMFITEFSSSAQGHRAGNTCMTAGENEVPRPSDHGRMNSAREHLIIEKQIAGLGGTSMYQMFVVGFDCLRHNLHFHWTKDVDDAEHDHSSTAAWRS